MNSLAIGSIVFICLFGGAPLGMFLRSILPEHNVSAESKDGVKVGIGLIATMAALVLGLLVATAKDSYDTKSNELTEMSVNTVMLDRMLAHYGSEARTIHEL
jgi:fluoride ion exporter CrcB/FEX